MHFKYFFFKKPERLFQGGLQTRQGLGSRGWRGAGCGMRTEMEVVRYGGVGSGTEVCPGWRVRHRTGWFRVLLLSA